MSRIVDDPGQADAVLCIRAADAHCCLAGSRVQQCHRCGADVWVSPRTLGLRKARPEVLLICGRCADQIEAEEAEAGRIAAEGN